MVAPAAEQTDVGSDVGGDAAVSEKSVLILGWFFASKRELEYVRRMYHKNGYTNVTVQPSAVGAISKPRGWYRTIRRQLLSDEPKPNAELARHFDVVHCLSGGFLALYVLRLSGVPLTFSSLLLDSTPIMPKPQAFTRFSRAYMRSIGLTLPLRLLPPALHVRLVGLRWSLGLLYVRIRHRVLVALGRPQGAALDWWTAGPVEWALRGEYGRVARHALGTVYEAAAPGARVLFAYNPSDPYIDEADVGEAAQIARDVGLRVSTAEVGCEHIKALFTSPRLIFRLLHDETNTEGAGDGPNADALHGLVHGV